MGSPFLVWLNFEKRKEPSSEHCFFGQGLNNAIDGFFLADLFLFGPPKATRAYRWRLPRWCGANYIGGLLLWRAGGLIACELWGDEDEKSFTLATWWMALLTVTRPFLAE